MNNREQGPQPSFNTSNQEGAGKPRQELIRQSGAGKQGKEHAANNPLAEQDAFYQAFWDRFVEKSSLSPAGEDPAFWPITMLNEFVCDIADREYLKNPGKRELAEKLVPIEQSIRRVNTTYAIIAYPHCQQQSRRDFIEAQLESDRQLYGRDQVALNDTELEIVGKLCKKPRYGVRSGIMEPQPEIPFQPHKRVYDYADVPIAPGIDPFGKRHMTTEEIRRELNPTPRLPKK